MYHAEEVRHMHVLLYIFVVAACFPAGDDNSLGLPMFFHHPPPPPHHEAQE